MKLYQATIVTNNSCYIETLLIVANDEKEAHDILCTHKKRKVQYTEKIKELVLDMTKSNVIPYVGWGSNDDSDSGLDAD